MHPKTPSLSVMIANYNMASYVESSLSSCMCQQAPVDGIFIVDDGSTDGSVRILKTWTDKPGIQLLQKENEGKARALNALLPAIDTDFVMELDADDWLDADAIATIKPYLASLDNDATVLYGNLRSWKQRPSGTVQYKGINKGKPVHNQKTLLSYRFPLGPRIYRTAALHAIGGFPTLRFAEGRLYEDVSVLSALLKNSRLQYKDFTVYNVREHPASITKRNHSQWNDFMKYLD